MDSHIFQSPPCIRCPPIHPSICFFIHFLIEVSAVKQLENKLVLYQLGQGWLCYSDSQFVNLSNQSWFCVQFPHPLEAVWTLLHVILTLGLWVIEWPLPGTLMVTVAEGRTTLEAFKTQGYKRMIISFLLWRPKPAAWYHIPRGPGRPIPFWFRSPSVAIACSTALLTKYPFCSTDQWFLAPWWWDSYSLWLKQELFFGLGLMFTWRTEHGFLKRRNKDLRLQFGKLCHLETIFLTEHQCYFATYFRWGR